MKDSYATSVSAAHEWVEIRRRKTAQADHGTPAQDWAEQEQRLAELAQRAAKALLADRADMASAWVTPPVESVREPAKPAAAPRAPVLALDPYALVEPSAEELPAAQAETAAPPEVPADLPVDLWNSLQRVPMGAQLDGKRARRSALGLVDFFRADPIAKGFDLLRTRLVRTIRAYGWRRIAVVAPTQGCGATFTAVNLALSLSRVPGSRTVLIDMNQRTPGVAEALGLRSRYTVNQFLSADVGAQAYLQRPASTLAVGLTREPCSYAAEQLHDPLTGEVLDDMLDMLDPDLVLYDLPPVLEYDDFAAFLPQLDGVLLVADGTQTVPAHISGCERLLEGQSQLLGVVLNRGRASGQGEAIF